MVLRFLQVLELWEVITSVIRSLPHFSTSLLSALQGLMLAGLSSRHRAILNLSIGLWNHTFGLTTDIQYPETLHKPLLRLASITEIELHGLPIEDGATEVSVALRYKSLY